MVLIKPNCSDGNLRKVTCFFCGVLHLTWGGEESVAQLSPPSLSSRSLVRHRDLPPGRGPLSTAPHAVTCASSKALPHSQGLILQWVRVTFWHRCSGAARYWSPSHQLDCRPAALTNDVARCQSGGGAALAGLRHFSAVTVSWGLGASEAPQCGLSVCR